MGSLCSASSGVSNAVQQFNTAASKIAKAFEKSATDNVDLSAEAVTLMESKNQFSAAVKVIQTADEIEKATLRLMA
jgi:flagellar hook protein FlgE